jgi:hypothetical protein
MKVRSHSNTMAPNTKRIMDLIVCTEYAAAYSYMVRAALLSYEVVATHAVGTYAECLAVSKVTLADEVEKFFSL